MIETDIYDQALVIISVWSSKCPEKKFFGMALADFEKAVAPSGAARTELTQLDTRRAEVLESRNRADRVTRRSVLRVVNGVKGDPEEGEDSELLADMGYVPHTARSSIVSAARKLKSAAREAEKAKENRESKETKEVTQ